LVEQKRGDFPEKNQGEEGARIFASTGLG